MVWIALRGNVSNGINDHAFPDLNWPIESRKKNLVMFHITHSIYTRTPIARTISHVLAHKNG